MNSLLDLFPREVVFDILKEDGEKLISLTFKAFTINDSHWIQKNIGDQKRIEKVFKDVEFDKICKIAFNQLQPLSKKTLFDIEFQLEDIDEDGKPVTVSLNGPQRIMEICKGPANEMRLVNSLLKSRGFNTPDMTVEDSDLNEKEDSKKKPIGERSLI